MSWSRAKTLGIGGGIAIAVAIGIVATSGSMIPSSGYQAIHGRSSSPDGVETAPRGTLVVDSTTGITWKNRSGSTRWDPVQIPPERGKQVCIDFDEGVYSATSIGGGSSSDASAAIATGRVGVRRLTASAAGADGAAVRISNVNSVVLGAGPFVFRAAVAITTLSDGTDRGVYRVGPGDATTFADHSDGVYLESDLATNSSNNWYLCAASNGTATCADTGIAPAAGTYQNVEIRVNADGTQVTAEIDGVAAADAVTANIPTGTGRAFSPAHIMMLKSLGSNARTMDADWMCYSQVLTTARGL